VDYGTKVKSKLGIILTGIPESLIPLDGGVGARSSVR
jgi:hypothetical protein